MNMVAGGCSSLVMFCVCL